MNKLFKLFLLVFSVAFLFLSIKALAQIPIQPLPINTNAPDNANTNLNEAPKPELFGQANPYPTYRLGEFEITDADLTKAGFTKPAVQPTVGSKFAKAPNYWSNFYFRGNEKVTGENGTAWGDTANLVSIFIRRMPIDWTYKDGKIETIDLAGKTQARVSTAGYYIVVTGPDKNKVTVLAENLEKLY